GRRVDFGKCRAGRDAAYAYSGCCDLFGQTQGKSLDRGFAGGIVYVFAGAGGARCNGRHVDDDAGRAVPLETGQSQARALYGAEYIDLEHPFNGGVGGIGKRANRPRDAGVIDQGSQGPKHLLGRFKNAGNVFGLTDIALYGNRFAALLQYGLHNTLCRSFVFKVVDGYVKAIAGGGNSRCRPNAATGSGDKNNVV